MPDQELDLFHIAMNGTKSLPTVKKSVHFNWEKIKILIVEDEIFMQTHLTKIILSQHENCMIDLANNGREGLKKAEENLPDLIICDLMMPELNGLEMIQSIQHNEQLKDTSFILITAFNQDDEFRKVLQEEINDYLIKPFTKEELIFKIKKIFYFKQIHHLNQQFIIETNHHIDRFSHELRTPLTTILLWSQLLKSDNISPEKLQKGLNTIEKNAKDQSEIINKILKMPRHEEKKIDQKSSFTTFENQDNKNIFQHFKVLVIEDEDHTREVLKIILQSMGFSEVYSSPSAEEGLSIIEQKHLQYLGPDIIISDLGLPIHDGYYFMHELQKLSFYHQQKPLTLALTGFADEQNITKTKKAGFDYCITKPIEVKELKKIIFSLVQSKAH